MKITSNAFKNKFKEVQYVANKTLNVRIQNKYDKEANWASKNPVLLKGEPAYSSDKNGLYKIGDGTSKWSDLKYNSANTLVNHTSGEGFEFGYANSKTITIPKTTAVTTYYIQIAQKANFRFKNYYVKTSGNNTQYSFQAEISANAYMEPHVTLNTQKYNDSEVKSILICKNSTNSYHHDIYLVVDSSTSVAKTIYIWSDNTILDTVSTTAPTTATELNVNITNDSYIYTSKKIQANITGSAGSVAWGNITGKPSTYYTHPSYTARSSGLYKVTVDATGHVSGATAVSKADITALGIPGTDTNTWRGVQNNLTSTATDQSLSAAQGKILNETKTTRHDWNTIIKCATWSRLCYVPYSKTVVGSSFLLNIRGTRNNVVYNDTFMIKAHHSSRGNIVKISGCNYSTVSIRIVCDSSGNCYVEFFDSANGATNATTQTVYCTLIEVAVGSITKYTSFTNGTTLPANFTVAATLTTNTNSLQGNLTWDEITGKPSTFTPSSHTHDDRYYTESEINSKLAGYLPISGGTLTGNLNLKPASGEGGEIHLDASTANRTENGIILDQQGGNFRIFGVPSADGTTKTGSGTPLVINPYSKTITGGYTLTGALSGNASTATALTASAGSATQPIYFSSGKPVATTHQLNASVPAGAKFTDTNTWRPLGTTGDTACAGNDSRLSNARPASDVYAWAKAASKPSYSWGEITGKPGAFNPSSHNHRDLDAIGSVGYYGSDVANSNGWYKVYSTTLTGYNDHVARLSIVSGYNPYASGLLILHLRCNNTTSLNVQQLIWETRQGFNADDVIINTNGNTWTLYLKITNTQYGRVKIRVLESTSTVNNWSISLSNNNTKESTNPKATATAKDGAIVNYANSAGSVAWSGISGKPSLVGKTIKSLTAASSSGWSDLTSAQNLIPDMSVIAYWNGAYSNTSSNLAYCNKGAFGTIVTKNAGDYATAGHTHHYAGSSSVGGSATSAVKLDTSTAGSATQPVYFTGGKPVACTYTLGKSVPSNAVFTDTNNKMTQTAIASKDYTNWRTILWGASNSGTEGFTPTTVTDGAFTDTNLSYQPSTGTLRAKVFKGALSANTTIGGTSGLETTLEFTAGEPKGTGAITQTYYLMNDFKTNYVFGVKNKSKAWISYYAGDQVYFKNSSADISALAGKMLPPVLTDFSCDKDNPGAGTGRVLSIASNVDAKIIKFRIFTSSSATTATTVNVTYSTSDIRLKDNVKDTDIKDALSVINKMKIRQFDWKDDNKHQKIGFVADELEELDDKLVVGGGWEDEEHTQMNVKGVDTFYMMGYVVKGMQELSEQIKALTEENKELKKQIEGLKREG